MPPGKGRPGSHHHLSHFPVLTEEVSVNFINQLKIKLFYDITLQTMTMFSLFPSISFQTESAGEAKIIVKQRSCA